jgi:hypothetical protein
MSDFILIIVGFLIAGAISVAFLRFVIRLWPRSGKMGINLEAVNCPVCGEKAPQVRKPKNIRQVLWGGWSCNKCSTEMDKYGESINS